MSEEEVTAAHQQGIIKAFWLQFWGAHLFVQSRVETEDKSMCHMPEMSVLVIFLTRCQKHRQPFSNQR